jgi:hypothetical protein
MILVSTTTTTTALKIMGRAAIGCEDKTDLEK